MPLAKIVEEMLINMGIEQAHQRIQSLTPQNIRFYHVMMIERDLKIMAEVKCGSKM